MRTRTGKRKGYKLKGLTAAEGTARAKKAWITKHNRYKYDKHPSILHKHRPFAAASGDDEDLTITGYPPGFGNRGDLQASLRQQARENLDMMEGLDDVSVSTFRRMSEGQRKEIANWIAQHPAESLPDSLKRELDAHEHDAFAALRRMPPEKRAQVLAHWPQRSRLILTEYLRRYQTQEEKLPLPDREEVIHNMVRDETYSLSQRDRAALSKVHEIKAADGKTVVHKGSLLTAPKGSTLRAMILQKMPEERRGRIERFIQRVDDETYHVARVVNDQLGQGAPDITQHGHGTSYMDYVKRTAGPDPRSSVTWEPVAQVGTRIRTLVNDQVNKDLGERSEAWKSSKHKVDDRTATAALLYKVMMNDPTIKHTLRGATKKKERHDTLTRSEIDSKIQEIASHAAESYHGANEVARTHGRERAIALSQDLGNKAEVQRARIIERSKNKEIYAKEFDPKRNKHLHPPAVNDPQYKYPRAGELMPYVRDPYEERLTVEEAYRASGHEGIKTSDKQKWHDQLNERLINLRKTKAKHGTTQRLEVNIMHTEQALKEAKAEIKKSKGWQGQARFTIKQNKNFYGNLKNGSLIAGWNGRGERVPTDQALLGVSPNKMRRYELNVRDKFDPSMVLLRPKVRHVEMEETANLHRGARDPVTLRLKEGEFDELRKVELVDKFQSRFGHRLGHRQLEADKYEQYDRERRTDPGIVAEREFIPVPGITRIMHKDIKLPDRARVVDQRNVPEGIRNPRDTVTIENAVKRVYFAPPEMMKTQGRSEISVQHGRGLGRRAWARVDEDMTHELRLPGLGVGPSIPTGRMITEPFRSQRMSLREAARIGNSNQTRFANIDDSTTTESKMHEELRRRTFGTGNENMRNNSGYTDEADSHLKTLAAAAGAATVYSTRRKAGRTWLPTGLNNAFNKFSQAHPRVAAFRTKYRMDTNVLPVKDVMRPMQEMIPTWKRMFRHPLSDPEGKVFGMEFGNLYYREHNLTNPTHAFRMVKKRRLELNRVADTMSTVFKPNKNWIESKLAARKDLLVKHPDYANFKDSLEAAVGQAEEVIHTYGPGTKQAKEAEKLIAAVASHKKLVHDIENNVGKFARPAYSGGAEVALRGAAHEAGFISKNRNAFMIGGALVGTTVGAHYLYHKHKERKKAPEDRVSYYNKILPKPFTTPPLPFAGIKSQYTIPDHPITRELLIANRHIPTGVGVGFKRRTVKVRPSDRGYAPNAKILGGFSGLSFIKGKGARGGSLAESVFYDSNTERRRLAGRGGGGKRLVVKGKEVPIIIDVGKPRMPNLRRDDPHKMTTEDREKLAYIFGKKKYMSRAEQVKWENDYAWMKEMHGDDPKLMRMLTDEKKLKEIYKKHGTAMQKRFIDSQEAHRRNRELEWLKKQSQKKASRDYQDYERFLEMHEITVGEIDTLPSLPGQPQRPIRGSLRERKIKDDLARRGLSTVSRENLDVTGWQGPTEVHWKAKDRAREQGLKGKYAIAQRHGLAGIEGVGGVSSTDRERFARKLGFEAGYEQSTKEHMPKGPRNTRQRRKKK